MLFIFLLLLAVYWCNSSCWVGSDTGKHGRIRESRSHFNGNIAKKSTKLQCIGANVKCPGTTEKAHTGKKKGDHSYTVDLHITKAFDDDKISLTGFGFLERCHQDNPRREQQKQTGDPVFPAS